MEKLGKTMEKLGTARKNHGIKLGKDRKARKKHGKKARKSWEINGKARK